MAEVISTATFGERRSHLMSAVFSTPSPSLVDSQETLVLGQDAVNQHGSGPFSESDQSDDESF